MNKTILFVEWVNNFFLRMSEVFYLNESSTEYPMYEGYQLGLPLDITISHCTLQLMIGGPIDGLNCSEKEVAIFKHISRCTGKCRWQWIVAYLTSSIFLGIFPLATVWVVILSGKVLVLPEFGGQHYRCLSYRNIL